MITFLEPKTLASWVAARLGEGINGTARVLIEYTKRVRNKGLLLEPVDIKKDLYGFVYAPERNSVASIILSRTHLCTTSSPASSVRRLLIGAAAKPHSLFGGVN
ncbi:MAG: hypothetical protein WB586_22665 [Chthoniobacterales bacterium]